jgi:hypothetical protein
MEEGRQKDQPELDPQISTELNRILEKEPRELTPEDKAFLRARKAYVGKLSRAKFADVFNESPQEEKEEKKSVDAKKPSAPANPHPAEKLEEVKNAPDDDDEEDESDDESEE